jgi:hypothetical protein
MIMWFIFALVLICLAYWLFKNAEDFWDNDLAMFGGIVAIAFAVVFILAPICFHLDYVEFEKQFEIQQEQFEMMTENGVIEEDNYTYIINVLDSNRELAEHQASKRLWGIFSTVPKRVFDIKPIGIK